ncbi:restriction endonuclease [Streptomyces sp. NRRL F-5650]|uniref:restriction endonuclease n=1 Tax=Streptomyces sp. NRRL F-5650 TaxID=1463868 RepID=UPI00056857ED|nr:restriction endonuclease [Streptomyces sp. NRRL F-5650]
MTVPEHRARGRRAGRRFDLRATTVTFGLAALALVLLGWAARMALDAAQRRPVWVFVLVLGAVTAVLLRRRTRGRPVAARAALRTTDALAAATATTLDALEQDREPAPAPAPYARGEQTTVAVVPAGDEELTPDEFEEAIADLCRRDGCVDVEVVGGAGDLGADVLAVAPDGRRVVIQCKRYSEDHKVGSQDLQRFGGTCFTVHEADVAVLVASTGFTAPAADYAEQCGIVCVDAQWLRDWREGGGPVPWEPLPPGPDEARPSGGASW